MSDIKLCKDCKHFHKSVLDEYNFSRCLRDETLSVNLVTGETIYIPILYCIDERKKTFFDDITLRFCGKKAKYFEAK